MEDLVQFEVREAGSKRIGVATLTREKALNSLRLETIDALLDNFRNWMADPDIACIVLTSITDRALCAGADITAQYHSIKDADGAYNAYGEDFFSHEYELDFMIRECEKPILAWGHNVVMGGGLGLLGGCSHRIGTAQSRIAMPEITIGLFPDAGATWFLSRMRSNLGYFIGLTGCQLGAGDAVDLGIINHVVNHEDQASILDGLATISWSGDSQANRAALTAHLAGYGAPTEDLPRNLLANEQAINDLIGEALAADDFFAVFNPGLQSMQDEWISQAAETYFAGSAVTARVFIEQMQRAKADGGMSLADMFRMELVIACQCLRHPDFPEGVRALLVDKDRNPQWSYADASSVPDDLVEAHFTPPWDANPLAHL